MYGLLKNIFSAMIIFFSVASVYSQVSTNWVIGSAGDHKVVGNLMISATVGEAVVTTFSQSGYMLTQGFHQPSEIAGGSLLINSTVKNASCLTAKNGELTANVINGTSPYNYSWSPEGGNTQTATGLAPGTYYLLVTDAMGREGRDTVTVGALADDACEIHIYGGITPNGDGINDVWHIDGISIFPDNTVDIFNRWGEKIWNASGYNNDDKVWKGQDLNGDPLPDGTYFYILEIPGMEIYKGWVQVTR